MVDGELCSSRTREALVQAGRGKGSTSSRTFHHRGRLCQDRRRVVRVLLTNLLRPSIRTQNDQGKDRGYSQVSLQRGNGCHGRKGAIPVQVWQASFRTVYRPRVGGYRSGRAL